MKKSRTQIQHESDAKRGLLAKTFKLPIATIDLINDLAKKTNKTKQQIIVDAVLLLSQKAQKEDDQYAIDADQSNH